MNLRLLYAITLFGPGLELAARMIQKSISIDYIEEKIQGTVFTYRRDMVDGDLKEVWMIDGKKVERDRYDDMILEAEMEERRKERTQAYKDRLRRLEFKESATRACYEKLILGLSEQLGDLIKKFKKYSLWPHMVYRQETIDCQEEFERLEDELLPMLKKCIKENVALHTLQETYQAVCSYPDRLTECLYETIQHAIKTVDDTKQLKELLALITEES